MLKALNQARKPRGGSMIVGVCNLKGGSGKTSTSMGLGAAAKYPSEAVRLMEVGNRYERTGFAASWGKELGIDTAAVEADQILSALAPLQSTNHVILDTPSGNRDTLRKVALVSEVIVVPTQESQIDMPSLRSTLVLLRGVKALKPSLRIFVLRFAWRSDAQLRRALGEENFNALTLEALIPASEVQKYPDRISEYIVAYLDTWREICIRCGPGEGRSQRNADQDEWSPLGSSAVFS